MRNHVLRTARREPLASRRLEGQVVAVGLLSKLAARSSDAEAPEMFREAISETIALATAGKIDDADEHLKGLARILGPAIRDGVVARRAAE